MRILVVDDSGAARSIIRRMLEGRGWEVLEADGGRSALAELEREPRVDLALIDWHMGEMDGPELVQLLRENPDYDNMKLMIVTSETDDRCVAVALERGADEFLMKPFTKEILLEKIEMLGGTDV